MSTVNESCSKKSLSLVKESCIKYNVSSTDHPPLMVPTEADPQQKTITSKVVLTVWLPSNTLENNKTKYGTHKPKSLGGSQMASRRYSCKQLGDKSREQQHMRVVPHLRRFSNLINLCHEMIKIIIRDDWLSNQ